jgi:nucleoside-diphosphate-sugar epimerase
MLEQLLRRAGRFPLPLGIRENRRSFISIDNICGAITTVLQARAGVSGRFYLCDGRDFSTAEFVERLAAALALPCTLIHVPSSFLRFGARLSGQRELASRLLDSFRIDDTTFRSTFNWTSDASPQVVTRAYAVDPLA